MLFATISRLSAPPEGLLLRPSGLLPAHRCAAPSRNDRLSGDVGNDTFVFAFGTGQDTIVGFTDGQGRIELSGINLTSLNIEQVGSDTVIQSGSDILVLEGVLRSAITDSDFIS